jgi:hypothetical protein
MLLRVIAAVISLVVMVWALYSNSKRWEEFMRRSGLSSTHGLDVSKDPMAVAERGAAAGLAMEERRRDLLARAPTDRKAAKELKQLLGDHIWALERTIKDIRRDSKLRSAISEDVFRDWDKELDELRRLKEQVSRYT